MEKPTHGSNESRAAEAVSRSAASNLPGTATSDADEDIDLQAKKIQHLRTMRTMSKTITPVTEIASRNQGSTQVTEITPRSKGSKWNKARAVMSAQSALTSRMMALRGLVGTTGEGSATIEETEEMLRKEQLLQRGKWYIVMPDSTFKMCWDLSQVVVLLYVAAVVPLRIGFDTTSEPFSTFWWVEVAIDIYFLIDIFLNFLTAFYSQGDRNESKQGVVIDIKEIRRQYVKGFFVVDLLSILPVSYIEQAMSGGGDNTAGGNLKTLKVLRLIRLTRLLRLARVKTLLKKYTDMLENLAGVFSLLSIIVVAIFLSHFVSCAWYWVGSIEGGWVARTFDCEECTHAGSSPFDKYLATYWWSLTLLLTAEMSNNIQPYSSGEIVFVILLQLMGAIVFGFIIGTVGTILMSWGLLEEKIARKLAELREYMIETNVPKSTRKKVKKFMEDYYRAKAGYDETEVIAALPPAIALELLDSIYRGALLKVPIFKDLDDDVICRICLLMKPMHVAKGEYVFREKELGREMYIIREGRVQILKSGMTIGVLHRNCFFGEDCMLQVQPGKRNRRARTAFAIQDCELAFLRATDADLIALDHPKMLESFQNLAAKKECIEQERLNMMINQVADELGVDPDSALMGDVLTAVSTIAADDEMLTAESKAARKVQNWWRHTQQRKAGLVKDKFPRSLAVSEADAAVPGLKTKIRKVMSTSSLWKVAASDEAAKVAPTIDLQPVPPAVSKPSNTAGRNSSGLASEIRAPRGATSLASPASANELIVSLHSMQDQLDKLENTQKSILAHQRESDLHAERLDSKLDSIASVIVKIDRRMAAQH